jgi:broad-specificity NMP kinase
MGCPGAGKSTVGVIVAEMLGMKYVDFDLDVLQPAWGMKVADKVDHYFCHHHHSIIINQYHHLSSLLSNDHYHYLLVIITNIIITITSINTNMVTIIDFQTLYLLCFS